MTSETRLLDREFTPAVCYELLPEWKGCELRITELSGGITNKLYRVTCSRGDVTVRIYGDRTDMFIDRDIEAHTIEQMAAIGVGSKLVKYMPEKGVTIVEFVDDVTVLTNDHFRDAALYPTIAAAIRKIHTSGVRLKQVFNPLLEVMKMSAIFDRLKAVSPEFDIRGTIGRLVTLSGIINLPESRYTPCHNDLLADNFLLVDPNAAGHHAAPLYIIDWEYGGMAPPLYDIADMFQEILVPRENERAIVAEYCQGENVQRTLMFVDLFKPFPDIYWFLWSMIQKNVSTIDFDYYTYGREKYENALKNLSFIGEEYGVRV